MSAQSGFLVLTETGAVSAIRSTLEEAIECAKGDASLMVICTPVAIPPLGLRQANYYVDGHWENRVIVLVAKPRPETA